MVKNRAMDRKAKEMERRAEATERAAKATDRTVKATERAARTIKAGRLLAAHRSPQKITRPERKSNTRFDGNRNFIDIIKLLTSSQEVSSFLFDDKV